MGIWNRVIYLVALAIAIVLLPRVYITVEEVISMFPIHKGEIVVFDIQFAPWIRAAFVAAHACVAGFVVLIGRGKATLQIKILTLILLSELVTIYVMTLLLWRDGVYGPPLY